VEQLTIVQPEEDDQVPLVHVTEAAVPV